MIAQQHDPTPTLPPRLDPRAIAAVVFGLLGLAFPIVPAIAAIALARRAQRTLERHGGRPASQDLASVGGALGWCGLAIAAAFAALLLVVALLSAAFGDAATTPSQSAW